MRVFRSVVIQEKTPSKGCRLGRTSGHVRQAKSCLLVVRWVFLSWISHLRPYHMIDSAHNE